MRSTGHNLGQIARGVGNNFLTPQTALLSSGRTATFVEPSEGHLRTSWGAGVAERADFGADGEAH
jgi:hypothetical protein